MNKQTKLATSSTFNVYRRDEALTVTFAEPASAVKYKGKNH